MGRGGLASVDHSFSHNSAGTTLGTTFEKNSNSVTVVFDIKCLSDVKIWIINNSEKSNKYGVFVKNRTFN